MKFSTKGRYALRMMLEFALHPGECTKINQVAERQEISDKYLEQIVTILSRAGYVKSRRGAQGGYYLTKDPSEYTVGMILRLAEGSLVPVTCLEDEVNPCSRSQNCATLMVWKELDHAISHVVDGITLADLVEEQKRLDGQANYYEI
ncbi:RrF2 family transcriptional regulator [Lacrimispora saccharolytica]|uniref:Transcriptional regulator, BadM/Rrf2 family n=1 Tax=Lacrimispora saccharolytica (strain ATCC 35040 / DSM 2544 / NRCC 2533 / WM1) TaxID=610130 RepID=D9R4W2_LACSW|nr:Rrf2 family transcriptional regulator [Lacrimispora saccharolytica]ADL05069.1 transcriptional regulator, BadM/Rrf2 family [[Clostridium] saccharolyticum WM1]QRV20740.1 Rrf2 family transcriptional regulator [Lacrimispora saccharolytica]